MQMSSYEANVIRVIVKAAVAQYQQARELEASVPLANVVDDPNDQEARTRLTRVLSKGWQLSNRQHTYGFAIVDEWEISEDLKILNFRVSPMVVDLFDGIDMSESLH
ncbi:hypothetical protein [Paraburkholderia caribensis]|uniref:hypothetical protein n=1 Tax=Paraburkholderia caribensis TaxID=75105 RepID=UPI0034D25E48